MVETTVSLVLDLDRIDVDGLRGGQAQGTAAAQVEPGTMEIALDGAVFDVPVAQRHVPMAADVVDGEVFALVKHNREFVFVDGERNLGAQFVEGGDGDEAH